MLTIAGYIHCKTMVVHCTEVLQTQLVYQNELTVC